MFSAFPDLQNYSNRRILGTILINRHIVAVINRSIYGNVITKIFFALFQHSFLILSLPDCPADGCRPYPLPMS